MEKMLGNLGIKFEYVLDGDRSDMNMDIVNRWFKGVMNQINNESSCALKHLYAYKQIVEQNLPGALILEDDIFVKDNFISGINACLKEYWSKVNNGLKPGLISFEDSSLKFVPESQKVKGQMIYKAPRDRFAGCYYVPYESAKMMLEYAEINKIGKPIDLWHTTLIEEIDQPYYWSSPTFASQGSHNGKFPSSISKGSFTRHVYQRFSWILKRAYKVLLYRFR